jgi:hypothetical protein
LILDLPVLLMLVYPCCTWTYHPTPAGLSLLFLNLPVLLCCSAYFSEINLCFFCCYSCYSVHVAPKSARAITAGLFVTPESSCATPVGLPVLILNLLCMGYSRWSSHVL